MATAAERAAAKKAEEAAEGTAENPVDVASIPMQVPVALAWARVMGDVQKIVKGDRTEATGKYQYRGVDRVMNEVGPALRKHGVLVIPHTISLQHRDVSTSTGKPSHEVIVEIGYTIIGPMGDKIEGGGAYGESADSNDKATPQAMSVAYRTWLLQALCIPSGDPDPDENDMQRGGSNRQSAEPKPDPAEVAAKDETAKEAGWKSDEDRAASFRTLMAALTKLDDAYKAPVIAWGQEQDLDPATFTKAQAVELNDQIETARITQERDAAEAKKKLEAAFTTEDGAAPHTEQQSYAEDEEPF